MKMVNAIKIVRGEEIGFGKKKHRMCSKCRDRQSRKQLAARKQL